MPEKVAKVLVVDDVEGWRTFNSHVAKTIFGDESIIETAESAQDAYNKVIANTKTPYDAIITDLQMEDDYAPKYAGEWLVEQIKALPSYYKSKIVMVSATYNIKTIADRLGVNCVPKSTAIKCISAYEEALK